MRFLDRIYLKYGESDFLSNVKDLGIDIEFVVEAGCHDGSDTLKILNELKPLNLFAFEPDSSAFELAALVLKNQSRSNIYLYPYALSDFEGDIYIDFLQQSEGQGISTVSLYRGDIVVQAKKLDTVIGDISGAGVLWLDVEGHAVKVLKGAQSSLRHFVAAKIEVQMHSISDTKPKDFMSVLRIMKESGLYPTQVPLHPGFSADMVFVRDEYLTKRQRAASKMLEFLMLFLHNSVYPALGKPNKLE
jgi:FkbM family methyltransferase